MTKIKLNLAEIYQLDSELVGEIDKETGTKKTDGILNKEIDLKIKFWLTELRTKTQEVVKTVDTLRNQTISKYGEKDDKGNITIAPYLIEKNEDGTDKIVENPARTSFLEDFSKLMEEEKELEFYPITIDDINIKTKEVYPVLFKMVKIAASNP